MSQERRHEQVFNKNSFTLLLLLAFFIMASYGIARTCIDSIFLEYHADKNLPIVWLATAAVAAFAMAGVNSLNSRYAVSKVFHLATILSLVSFCILFACLLAEKKTSSFLLYIWKDLYIIVLAETFWSYADITISLRIAKWVYGLLLAVASIGGIVANYLIKEFLIIKIGTINTVLSIIPVFLICILISYFLHKVAPDQTPNRKNKYEGKIGQSIKIVLQSAYLKYVLMLVVLTQIIITLVDFKFNAMLQENYPILDERTSITASIHMLVDSVSLVIQLLTGLIFKVIGVQMTLISLPIIGSVIVLFFVIIPRFTGMVVLKIASKSLDYSLFKSAKEILYIPLNRKEKTQGKSFIDIFVYRASKGLASAIIVALTTAGLLNSIIPIILFLQLACIFLSYMIIKRYRIIQKIAESFYGKQINTNRKAL